MRNVTLFLHGPRKFVYFSKYLPFGTKIVAGWRLVHAVFQAFMNGPVESVFPSGFAPKATTLYLEVGAACEEPSKVMHKIHEIIHKVVLTTEAIILGMLQKQSNVGNN